MSGFARFVRLLFLLGALTLASGLAYAYAVGAWHSLFPSTAHDSVEPYLPPDLQSPAVLVFSKTNGFRHKDGIVAGRAAIEQIARGQGWQAFFTENGAVFNTAQLAAFDAVVFMNATGDMLSRQQQTAFQNWLEAGGGWLGLHAAGDDSHSNWPWYVQNLIGADFVGHTMGPQIQVASVVTEQHDHPVVQNIPNVWNHTDEWYSFAHSPRVNGFTVLAALDEGSYTPVQNLPWGDRDLRMGDHPVVWSNCIGQGRSVYMAMGHGSMAFGQETLRQLIANAVNWFMDDAATGC